MYIYIFKFFCTRIYCTSILSSYLFILYIFFFLRDTFFLSCFYFVTKLCVVFALNTCICVGLSFSQSVTLSVFQSVWDVQVFLLLPKHLPGIYALSTPFICWVHHTGILQEKKNLIKKKHTNLKPKGGKFVYKLISI